MIFSLRNLRVILLAIGILGLLLVGNSRVIGAALVADAGPDKLHCLGGATVIGGSPTASGGDLGWTYTWSPAAGLDYYKTANPTARPSSTMTYTVQVIDSGGHVATDSMTITVGTAAIGGTTSVPFSPVRTGSGTDISLSGQSGNIVKWQSSTDGTTWSDIASTANPLSTGNLTQQTGYRALLTSAICGGSVTSTVTTVSVDLPPPSPLQQIPSSMMRSMFLAAASPPAAPPGANVIDGLVAWWKMDEGSGTTTADSSGNGYTMTLVSGYSPTWVTGLIGAYCLNFNGSQHAKYIGGGFPTTAVNSTFTMWLYCPSGGNSIQVINCNSSGTDGLGICINSGALDLTYPWAGDNMFNSLTVPRDTWIFAAVVKTGTSAIGYIWTLSSNTYVSQTISLLANTTGNGNAGLGILLANIQFYGYSYMTYIGKIDDFRQYNRALTFSEVQAIYNWRP